MVKGAYPDFDNFIGPDGKFDRQAFQAAHYALYSEKVNERTEHKSIDSATAFLIKFFDFLDDNQDDLSGKLGLSQQQSFTITGVLRRARGRVFNQEISGGVFVDNAPALNLQLEHDNHMVNICWDIDDNCPAFVRICDTNYKSGVNMIEFIPVSELITSENSSQMLHRMALRNPQADIQVDTNGTIEITNPQTKDAYLYVGELEDESGKKYYIYAHNDSKHSQTME